MFGEHKTSQIDDETILNVGGGQGRKGTLREYDTVVDSGGKGFVDE